MKKIRKRKDRGAPKAQTEVTRNRKLLEVASKQIPKVLAIGNSFCLHFIILCLIIVYEAPQWSWFFTWKVTNNFILETVWAICHATWILLLWFLISLNQRTRSNQEISCTLYFLVLCREVICFPPGVWVSHIGIHPNSLFICLFMGVRRWEWQVTP